MTKSILTKYWRLMSYYLRSVEQFLETYQEKRCVAHLRRIKVDKMKELMMAKSTPSRAAPPPPRPYLNYGQPSVAPLPYPSQPMNNMPMAPNYRY